MKKSFLLLLAVAASATMFAQTDFPEGAAKGVFSVSENKQVYISQGNLYYKMAEWIGNFYFQDVDTAFVGTKHKWNSSEKDYLVDLFGWATSGTDNFYPYLSSTNNADYYNVAHNLYDRWLNPANTDYILSAYDYDWGSNRIANGGNTEDQWRTLGHYEWDYLLSRTDADGYPLAAFGCVRYQDIVCKGWFVLPDDWTGGRLFANPSSEMENQRWYNDYVDMVAKGAIFLPFAGYREGTTIYGDDDPETTLAQGEMPEVGYYWCADGNLSTYTATCMIFDGADIWYETPERHIGAAVRLVQDVKRNVKINNVFGTLTVTDNENLTVKSFKTYDTSLSNGNSYQADIATGTKIFLDNAGNEDKKLESWSVKYGDNEPVAYEPEKGILVTTSDIVVTPIYKDISTSVETAQTTRTNTARKLLRNGQIIILRDGKEYNVLGAEVE